MSKMEIELKGELSRINPQPGDVFVLSLNYSMNSREAQDLKDWLKAKLPQCEILVVNGKAEVVRPDAVAAFVGESE